jgi:hypothetical protein
MDNRSLLLRDNRSLLLRDNRSLLLRDIPVIATPVSFALI